MAQKHALVIDDESDVTFLIVAAAGMAIWTPERIKAEQALGRRVSVVATPAAAEWLDANQIEGLTGWPLRINQRTPTVPTFDPPGRRVLASPVTLNTLTKWARGHADNLALSLLIEATFTDDVPVSAEVSLSEYYAKTPRSRKRTDLPHRTRRGPAASSQGSAPPATRSPNQLQTSGGDVVEL